MSHRHRPRYATENPRLARTGGRKPKRPKPKRPNVWRESAGLVRGTSKMSAAEQFWFANRPPKT